MIRKTNEEERLKLLDEVHTMHMSMHVKLLKL